MTRSDELIILHTTKFSDNAVVVHTLSREYGRRGFLVRRPRMSLFLPLNIVEAEITESGKSRLFLARNFSCDCALNGIRNNISKNCMTLFLSEVLFKAIKEEAREEGLYEWCRSRILLLDAIEKDFANFHLLFLLELARQLGFAPEEYDLLPFSGEYREQLSKLVKLPFSEAMLIPLSGESRNAMAEILIRYLEFHCESAININSLAVLREIFV